MRKKKSAPPRSKRMSHEYDEDELRELAAVEFPDAIYHTDAHGVTCQDVQEHLGLNRGTVEGWISRGEFPEPIGTRRSTTGGPRSWVYPGKLLSWIEAARAEQVPRRPLFLRDFVPGRQRNRLDWPPLYSKGGQILRRSSAGWKRREGISGVAAGDPVGLPNVRRSVGWKVGKRS